MSGSRASSSLPVFLSAWLVRAFVGLVTRLFYPLRVRGRENLPLRGGVLLISNHVSYVDWLLLTAAAKRPVRFLIGKQFYASPWLRPFVRVARVIPIPSALRPHEVMLALRRCGEAICSGEVACVFAEGGITRTGRLQPFQRGFEKIMHDPAWSGDAHRAGGPHGFVGQPLQFCRGGNFLEMAEAIPPSRDGELWPAPAAHRDGRRGAYRRGKTFVGRKTRLNRPAFHGPPHRA